MIKLRGNGYLLEFECDRCSTKFWARGGIAQIDCPVCTPKNLSNHPRRTCRTVEGTLCRNKAIH